MCLFVLSDISNCRKNSFCLLLIVVWSYLCALLRLYDEKKSFIKLLELHVSRFLFSPIWFCSPHHENANPAPPSSIYLRVMATTCITGDITELRVSVNGAQKGTLDASPGASGKFAGTSGSNAVMVVAKFGNGAESVVYEGVL